MLQTDHARWFLTEAEKALAETTPDTGFLPDFVRWVNLKSDAPPYGVKAAGLAALSLAAGDTVLVENFFDDSPLHLNLYIMLVGPSTTMRKTTILSKVQALMPKNLQSGQDILTVLDDASPQAFNRAMADAGRLQVPLLYSVDEVAGLFEVSRKKNSYLAGFDKILMKAFDHHPVHIHRTNSKIESDSGAFVCVFAATTPDPLAEVLTQDDIESGLLPRFIVLNLTDAQRGPDIPLAEKKRNSEEFDAIGRDLAAHLGRICTRATGVPTGYDPQTQAATYPKTVLTFTNEATDRLDALNRAITRSGIESATGVAAMTGRAFHHITKLAALHRLSRMTGAEVLDAIEVDLIDVLKATNFAETALDDLVALSERFGANDHERRVAEAVAILDRANGQEVEATTIASRLNLTGREAREVYGTLTARGIASFRQDGLKAYWSLSRHAQEADRLTTLTKEVASRGRMSRTELSALFGRNLSATELDRLIEKAVSSGVFQVVNEKTEGRGRPTQYLQKI